MNVVEFRLHENCEVIYILNVVYIDFTQHVEPARALVSSSAISPGVQVVPTQVS